MDRKSHVDSSEGNDVRRVDKTKVGTVSVVDDEPSHLQGRIVHVEDIFFPDVVLACELDEGSVRVVHDQVEFQVFQEVCAGCQPGLVKQKKAYRTPSALVWSCHLEIE
jgi:hypothetical protein